MNAQVHAEITVGAFIFNPSGKILLCKSEKWNNQYVIPGGHVEFGETMEAALKREVLEETRLDIYDIRLISLQESIFSEDFRDKKHFLFVDFLCRTDSSEVILNDEAEEFVWAKPDEILQYDLGGFVREFFREFQDQNSGYKHNIFYNYVHQNTL